MALGQAQYFYTVELSALEENLSHSIARIASLREKAIKRSDLRAADEINKIERVIDVVKRRITRMK
ncbi:MAG: hypothetical protein ABSG84_07350 [Acidobacteriaceae bacterium]